MFYISMFLKLFVNQGMAKPWLKRVIVLSKIEFSCIYTDINFVYW
jgi:hypothetical protein